jgi:hypothetical protein
MVVLLKRIFIRNGELIIQANGDNYTGTTQGRDRIGKIYTEPLDPQFGLPWKTGWAVVLYLIKNWFWFI